MLFSDCGAEKGVTASAPSADTPGPPFNVGQGEYIDRAYNESPRRSCCDWQCCLPVVLVFLSQSLKYCKENLLVG